jgi:hypothetical protein
LRALQPHLAPAASGAPSPSDQLAVKINVQQSHRRLRALALAAQCLAFSGGRDAEYRAHWQPAIATARVVLADTQSSVGASAAAGTGSAAVATTKNSSKCGARNSGDGGDCAIAVEEQRFLAHLTLARFATQSR